MARTPASSSTPRRPYPLRENDQDRAARPPLLRLAPPPNAGTLKASPSLIAAHVGHDHAPRARMPTLPHHLRNQFWICIRRLLRRAIPGDVRLQHHHLLFAHEPPNPAEILERLRQRAARALAIGSLQTFFRERHRHLRPLRVRGHAMVAPRLLAPAPESVAGCARSARLQRPPHPRPRRPRAAVAASLRAASSRVLHSPHSLLHSPFVAFAAHRLLLVKLRADGCAADRSSPAGARRRQPWQCNRASSRCFESRHVPPRRASLDHLPRNVIQCDAILAHHQCVGIPEPFRPESRPAVIHRRQSHRRS